MTTEKIIFEAIGMVGTIFALTSFCISGETKIRTINIIAAVIFVIYGFLIVSISMFLTNIVLIFIHIFKFYKIYKNQKAGKETAVSEVPEI